MSWIAPVIAFDLMGWKFAWNYITLTKEVQEDNIPGMIFNCFSSINVNEEDENTPNTQPEYKIVNINYCVHPIKKKITISKKKSSLGQVNCTLLSRVSKYCLLQS